MGLEGRATVRRYSIIKGLSQQGLKFAAFYAVLWFFIHCLPAFYYEKVIAQVPFFRGLFWT
jgi:hypothetical protein